jgi:hypothetical protein
VEVAKLVARLRRARRGDRISLAGPGGIGKTAIAREAMARVAECFPGGVHAHDFYVAPSLAAFEQSLLGSYGEEHDPEIRGEILHNLLSAEPALVYAEGLEKLRDHPAAATLPELIALCDNAVLLITWREPLDPAATEIWNIGALPVDEAAHLIHAHLTHGAAGSDPSPITRDLALLLGCQPLALTVAGCLWRQTQADLAGCVDTLRSEGLERLDFARRPDAALDAIFRLQAAALPLPARRTWYALSLHDFCLTRLKTLAACLEQTESETAQHLEALVARGLAEPGPLPRQPCHAEETAWRLAHPRLAEWGRTRLPESGVDTAAIIIRWKSHWQAVCHHGWRGSPVGGNRAWKAFHAAHLRAFLKNLQHLDGDSTELMELANQCAQFGGAFGLVAEALEFADVAVEIGGRVHRPNSQETIACRITQANAMLETTRGRGIETMESLLPQVIEMHGPAHPLALRARSVLASLLLARQERAEDTRALRLLHENLQLPAASDPTDLELQFFSQETLTCHMISTEHPDAKSSVLELLRWPDTHPSLGASVDPEMYRWAAWFHQRDEEPGAALGCLRQADSALHRVPFAEPDIFDVRADIIGLLVSQERWDEAVSEAEDLIMFARTLPADSAHYVSLAEEQHNAARERRILTDPDPDPEGPL